jgi:hypothetical protein
MTTLNDQMQVDHVIRINPHGEVDEGNVQGVYAPELHVGCDEDGQVLPEHDRQLIEDAGAQGWTLLAGWTGQSGYNGPVMHPSEFVGGQLEDHIRETPGLYVAVVIDTEDEKPAGWAIAYRET